MSCLYICCIKCNKIYHLNWCFLQNIYVNAEQCISCAPNMVLKCPILNTDNFITNVDEFNREFAKLEYKEKLKFYFNLEEGDFFRCMLPTIIEFPLFRMEKCIVYHTEGKKIVIEQGGFLDFLDIIKFVDSILYK